MSLKSRLIALESIKPKLPYLSMEIHGVPTEAEINEITEAVLIDRQVIVFVAEGNTIWLPGMPLPDHWKGLEGTL